MALGQPTGAQVMLVLSRRKSESSRPNNKQKEVCLWGTRRGLLTARLLSAPSCFRGTLRDTLLFVRLVMREKTRTGKGSGTVVSPWRKVLETERFPGSERSE